MWVQVRSIDGSKCIRINNLSKLTKIEELRLRIADEGFDAPPELQRLFYRGKQLEDGHSLFDYRVGLNDIIQLMIRPLLNSNDSFKTQITATNNKDLADGTQGESATSTKDHQANNKHSTSDDNAVHSEFFKIGDLVDAKIQQDYGAWFEGKITTIVNKNVSNGNEKSHHEMEENGHKLQKESVLDEDNLPFQKLADDGLIYHVALEGYEEEDPDELTINEIRPRACHKVAFDEIVVGDFMMVNYNIDEPHKRGYWFDCRVTKKIASNGKQLIVTIYMGNTCKTLSKIFNKNRSDDAPLENCKVLFLDDIFRIEKTSKLVFSQENYTSTPTPPAREKKPRCDHCKDLLTRKCKFCSCHVCGGKNEFSKQILCDECDMAYHLWCLNPPLLQLPEEDEEWYCPLCKNDSTEVVKAGEKLKESKKKARMPSANCKTKRDWGKGMACVGFTKECTIVPHNHFGPIPGIEVGMLWRYRNQVSESGVHRPPVAGIHGRPKEGAFSIVLSGGYEDDVDKGDEFMYTGSGGRDLSGNRRTAAQSFNQTLTLTNMALAFSCATLVNKSGAEAKNWKEGKPVRVIRNYKGRKHSKFCPEEGNRYDGIYKVVKYWPEKGKSGFVVWRYLLKRDDPTPAPWTKAGMKRTKELGFDVQYPDGCNSNKKEEEVAASPKSKKRPSKRSNSEEDDVPSRKKSKYKKYELPSELKSLIQEDEVNKKLWGQCTSVLSEGQQRFLKEVEQVFTCVCCQELVAQPVTTECHHNICKACLKRSFKAEVFDCPMCRNNLGKNLVITVNSTLAKTLITLFPGYETGR